MAATKEMWETTAVDLGALLDEEEGAMVTLVVEEVRLVVHRALLAARSPVFAAMFQYDTQEANSGQVTITDVECPVLRQLLSYMHSLQAPQLPGMAPQLLAAADKYGASGLMVQCERQLAAQLTVETAALAVRHSCSSRRQAALAYVRARTHQVMATQGWADATHEQPEDLIEFSRLLYDPLAETSAGRWWDWDQHHRQQSPPAPWQPHVYSSCTAHTPV